MNSFRDRITVTVTLQLTLSFRNLPSQPTFYAHHLYLIPPLPANHISGYVPGALLHAIQSKAKVPFKYVYFTKTQWQVKEQHS